MFTREDPLDLVVANFLALESQLIQCMEYIPYIEANMGVVSPKFPSILSESCSLMESIFQHLNQRNGHNGRGLKGYAGLYEEDLELESTYSMFLASPLTLLNPFSGWTKGVPAWWSAYNQTKHDRINSYNSSSFRHVVSSLSALHQVMARSRLFLGNMAKAGWFNERDEKFSDLLAGRAAGAGTPPDIAVESKLFVTPVSGNFVRVEEGRQEIDAWEFSERVKNFIWEDYEL